MRRLGIHSFVWTGGQTQDGLYAALGYRKERGSVAYLIEV